MNPMSLARETIRAAFGEGSGVNPWRQAGTHSCSTGAVREEAVEKEAVRSLK
jgi:hypothetical protein